MATHSPDRLHLIQAYMTLHSQQTNVRRRLSQDSTASSSPTLTNADSLDSSSLQSPVNSYPASYRRVSVSVSTTSSSPPSRRSSIEPIPETPEAESSAVALSNDELKLADISNRIKMTLTDLINCDGVRHDLRMRNWVATRLMDVEHELKDSKRRRHSADAGQVSAISTSLRE